MGGARNAALLQDTIIVKYLYPYLSAGGLISTKVVVVLMLTII